MRLIAVLLKLFFILFWDSVGAHHDQEISGRVGTLRQFMTESKSAKRRPIGLIQDIYNEHVAIGAPGDDELLCTLHGRC